MDVTRLGWVANIHSNMAGGAGGGGERQGWEKGLATLGSYCGQWAAQQEGPAGRGHR